MELVVAYKDDEFEEDEDIGDQKRDKSLKSCRSSSSEDSVRRLNKTPTILVEAP